MLGSNIVEVLHNSGFEVRAIVRRSNNVVDRFCEVIIGNVGDLASLKNAILGCDAVVHVAAITDQSLPMLDDYVFNWSVVENVARIALELGVKKVIMISTTNSIGNGSADHLANENTPLKTPYIDSLYGKSKVIAQERLFSLFPNAVVLNPTFMIGKYDSKPSSGYLIKMGYKKRVVFVPSGGKNFVPAIDVARAVVSAINNDVSGSFIVGGYEMTFKQFMFRLSVLEGCKTYVIVWPKWLLTSIGWLGTMLRYVGFRTPISSANMGILNGREFYSSQRAIDSLGYFNSDFDTAIVDSASWMIDNGVIKG